MTLLEGKSRSCKHLRKSLLKKTGGVDDLQAANCRFKMTGASKAKEIHGKLYALGIDQGEDPGIHCPLHTSGEYAKCPWYTEERR